MKPKDRHGLLLLAILVALLFVAGWTMMRSGRASMRENAAPGAEHQSTPQMNPQPATQP